MSDQFVFDLLRYRRSMKAKAILANPAHLAYVRLVQLLDDALELDPPDDRRRPAYQERLVPDSALLNAPVTSMLER